MLFIVPIVVIVLIVFMIDSIYFSDAKPTKEPPKVVKEKKVQQKQKDYINKYLKQ
jgi:hypothetical protein